MAKFSKKKKKREKNGAVFSLYNIMEYLITKIISLPLGIIFREAYRQLKAINSAAK